MQVVPLAELMAFIIYLRHAVPAKGEYTFVTDCAYVAEGFGKGKHAMCNGWAAHSQHWREAYRLIGDIGYEVIKVHLVKAHRKVKDATGKFDEFLIRGNAFVDLLAKEGANRHPFDPKRYEGIKELHAQSKAIAKFVATEALLRVKGACPKERYSRIPQEPPQSKAKLWVPGMHMPAYDTHGKQWRCRPCLLTCKLQSMPGRCETSWVSLGHKICRCQRFFFCSRCGCYSQKRTAKLGVRCTGHHGLNSVCRSRLSRLMKGCDPFTGQRIGEVTALNCSESSMSSAIGSNATWEEVAEGGVEL